MDTLAFDAKRLLRLAACAHAVRYLRARLFIALTLMFFSVAAFSAVEQVAPISPAEAIPAKAAAESVPLVKLWCAGGVNACTYSTDMAAAQAEADYYNVLIYHPAGYPSQFIVSCNGVGYCLWGGATAPAGYYFTMGVGSAYSCPAPATNPTMPYVYNRAAGMCERAVDPCPTATPPYTLNPAGNTCDRPAVCPAPIAYPEIPYIYNAANLLCKRTLPETYYLALTPEATTIEPGETYTFTATVTKQGGGAPSQPIPVSVEVEVESYSGGHDHDTTRPKGSVSPASGNNSFQIEFTSTEVSGTHFITATCDLCENKIEIAMVDVKVPGLWPIPPSGLYALYEADGSVIGAVEGRHPSNHYLTTTAANKLLVIAINYHHRNPQAPVLHVNDASLMWGGRFDISANWSAPHNEHMRGTVVDLRANESVGAIPPEIFKEFEFLLDDVVKEGERKFLLECTKDKPDKKGVPPTPKHKRLSINYCVSQLDGSFDSNRHYHVRLMGVAE